MSGKRKIGGGVTNPLKRPRGGDRSRVSWVHTTLFNRSWSLGVSSSLPNLCPTCGAKVVALLQGNVSVCMAERLAQLYFVPRSSRAGV